MPLAKLNESYEFSGDELCSYGCDQKASFAFLNGKFCCSRCQASCPLIKQKNAKGQPKHWKSNRKQAVYTPESRAKQAWNRGLTKETSEAVARGGVTYSNRVKSGEIIPVWKGKKLPIETREKISQNATGWITGGRTKWYEIFCPYTNSSVKVQGKLEFSYAKKLNDYGTSWVKDRHINLRYKTDDGVLRTYYPDFFLPDTQEYIEIKGFWQNVEGRISDKMKMSLVIRDNPTTKLKILMKSDIDNM